MYYNVFTYVISLSTRVRGSQRHNTKAPCTSLNRNKCMHQVIEDYTILTAPPPQNNSWAFRLLQLKDRKNSTVKPPRASSAILSVCQDCIALVCLRASNSKYLLGLTLSAVAACGMSNQHACILSFVSVSVSPPQRCGVPGKSV